VPTSLEAPLSSKRPKLKRRLVCLVSANPLALPELHRLALRARLRIRHSHLDLNAATETRDPRISRASVYVLDSFSTGAMTEAVVAAIRTRHPAARIVVLLDQISEATGVPLLQLGIKGLVALRAAQDDLPRAIVAVSSGGLWMPRRLISSFLDRVLGSANEARTPPTSKRLSLRERQVLDCVLKSQSNKEIGTSLNISESTVKFHLARLFEKFGVRRRSDLILQSIQQPAALVH